MKVSINWIKELLPKLKASPPSIEKRLTNMGHEVEEITRQADAFAGIVVGEVKSLRQHPNADKLQMATVFDGESTLSVACGAPNIAAGRKIAFARPGTTLPVGMKIEKREIRGEVSEGMICSLAELGIVDQADGILVFPSRAKPGKPIANRIGKTDVVFEVSATPNRPDVLSHFGLAREVAASYRLPLPIFRAKVKEQGEPASTQAKVEIRSGQRCARYVARVVQGVKVGPSPDWVVRRLEAVGLRSISNVVDASNLVLMELGHPLHAFDLHKLGGNKIVVRRAKTGEKLKTIDEEERSLDPDDLIIADARVPIAIAGVMGGADSEVSNETVDVLLESALFDPKSVRRTAKRHTLHTEASHRFERGCDPLVLDKAIDRCAQLIVELAGGRVLPGRVEAVKKEHKPKIIPIRPDRASLLIGRPVDRKEVRATLTALGLKRVRPPVVEERLPRGKKTKPKKKKRPPLNAMFFEIPSWRVDLQLEVDLIEEVARMSGYDSIPTIMPPMPSKVWTEAPAPDLQKKARELLTSAGFSEAISLAFNSPTQLGAVGGDIRQAVTIANPLGEESSLMRMSILPALLKAARLNQSLMRVDLRLFELGSTFRWSSPPGELPEETSKVGILIRGLRSPRAWASDPTPVDIYDLKAPVERLLEAFCIPSRRVAWVQATDSWLHPASATEVLVDDILLGSVGELHPDAMESFGLEGLPVFVAELDLDKLKAAKADRTSFKALPKYPAVGRDLSFFLDRGVAATSILEAVSDSGVDLLEDVRIFDVYEGKGVPGGKRSVAIRLTFRVEERTLTDPEVDSAEEKIAGALEKLGAQIRSG